MRSLTARLTVGILAAVAAGGAAYYLFELEGPLEEHRARMTSFDQTARSVMASLDAARAAQLSYVIDGQGAAVWQPTVEAALSALPDEVDALRSYAATDDARAMLMETAARVRDFAELERRTHEYLNAGDRLMASDVVLAEGSPAAAAALELVDAAWRVELEELGSLEAGHRLRQLDVAGGATIFVLSVVLLLAIIGPVARGTARQESAPSTEDAAGSDLRLRGDSPAKDTLQKPVVASVAMERPATERDESPSLPAPQPENRPPVAAQPVAAPAESPSLLRNAADICVSLGAVNDSERLHDLLGRAAGLMQASGVIVWVGDAEGGDLKASIAHGYPAQILGRMPAIPRTADNAAAVAYRTATLQVVTARSGQPGTVVAPMVTPAGCVGALTAEVAAGRETSESTHALSLLFAAQLSALLTADASASTDAHVASA
ncbi:MAG: hypothetical protein AB7P22_19030 [Vicinamibacterales bacterium]